MHGTQQSGTMHIRPDDSLDMNDSLGFTALLFAAKFRVYNLGLRIQGLRCKVWDLRFRV